MARILTHIVEQHAEEAAFLWLLRDKAVDAPHYKRHHLARLDERVEANLDGLRVAGEDGWRIAMAGLAQHQEVGELFAAGILALESDEPEKINSLVAIADKVADARRGLLGAIGWVASARLKLTVQRWLDSKEPFARYLGVVACSHHRADPGARLADWLTDPSPLVRARALRLVGELGRIDLAHTVTAASANDTDPTCRVWAAWCAGLLGEHTSLPLLTAAAEAGGPLSCHALEVAVRLAAPDHVKAWVRRLNGDPARRRIAVRTAGILGDPVAIPWLVDRMRDFEFARIAGESFSLITGVDLADQDLDGGPSEDLELITTDDLSDEDRVFDPDDQLLWPDPERVALWWKDNGDRMTCGRRHILGQLVNLTSCEVVFREGYQRQRRAAAYEQALLRASERVTASGRTGPSLENLLCPMGAYRERVSRPKYAHQSAEDRGSQ